MAVLELGIELNNIQIASKALDGLQKQLSSLGGKKIDVGAGAFNEARTRAQEALAKLREFNLEQKKIKAISPDLNPYQKLSRELTEMRNEAKSLGAQLILLEKAGMGSGVMANTLRNRFDVAQKEVVELDAAVKKLDGSLGQYNRHVGNYERSQGNANGVAMEFNRIIQDAPFGMMGIGNNIQQLVGNWQQYTQSTRSAAAETGKAVTTMSLVKGAMGAILSPVNLLSLGVAAVTSAWTVYTMWQQKANKSDKEKTQTTKELVEALKEQLNAIQQANSSALSNLASETTKLNGLWKITQDVTSSTRARKNALQELQNIYPNVFKNFDIETIKTNQASAAYQRLTKNIELSAKARAYESKLAEAYSKKFDLEAIKEKDLAKFSDPLNRLIAEQKNYAGSSVMGIIQQMLFGDDTNLVKKFDEKTGEFATAMRELGKTDSEIKSLQDALMSIYKETANTETGFSDLTKTLKGTNSSLKESFDYLQKIKDLLADKNKDLDLINLDGQAKDLKELEWKYKDFFNELDQLEKKYKADKNKNKQAGVLEGIDSARITGQSLKIAEQTEILKKWRAEYEKIVEETRRDAGFTAIESLEKDLALNEAKLNESFKRMLVAGGNFWESFYQIGAAKMMSEYNIKIKWQDKDLEEWGKMNDKLQEIIDKPFKGRDKNSLTREFQNRTNELRKAYEKLHLLMGTEIDEAEWGRLKAQIQLQFDETSKTLFRNFLVDTINSSYQQLMGSLKQNVEQFGSTFRAVFYSIGETIQSAINNINTENISNLFEKIKTSGWDSVSAMEKAAAGMALAGNIISSITPQTSAVGQGIGGALSGAASGFMVGGPIGAAIGGGLGLLSGILSANKRKKEEERQRQQLEEQKKTNALLERMNALAYTSQIIGGKTTNGIVTGVNRNEFGEITVRIEGRDLVGSFNRTNTLSGR